MLGRTVSASSPQPVPLDPVTAAGRRALRDYINDVLFNARNEAGRDFRSAALACRCAADQVEVRARMLIEAQSWSRNKEGWRRGELGANTLYTGRLFNLHTTLEFSSSGKVTVHVDVAGLKAQPG